LSSLEGAVAVVTGGSRGIGYAVAAALVDRDARVWLVARDEQRLAAAADTLGAGRAVTHPADLTDEAQRRGLVDRLTSDAGQLDVLVHCAGIIAFGRTVDADVAELEAQLQANLLAPYAVTQALLPMLRASRGQVVFMNSSAAYSTPPGAVQFASTMHAVRAVSDGLRQEVNRDGIRVLSVHPGRTATDRQVLQHGVEGKPYHPERLIQPADIATMVVTALALPRTVEVTEIRLRPMLPPLGS
jgi:NADP-dependent 3-hydroxy acid dehydrogenase YdfG